MVLSSLNTTDIESTYNLVLWLEDDREFYQGVSVGLIISFVMCSTGGRGRGGKPKVRDPNKPRNSLFKKRFT